MSKITKKQFLADVMHEIEMLKKNATNYEKNNLDFYTFDPESKSSCIYGQMTGDCKSERASNLIEMCCRIVVVNDGQLDSLENILPVVNGQYNNEEFEKGRRTLQYLSSLEGYIMADEAKNESIIKYIKGETDNLTL